MHPFLNIANKAVRRAGRLAVQFLDHLDTLDIQEKGRLDFVTQADQRLEEEIVEQIRAAYPKHTILGEEGGLQAGDDGEPCWIIDPIDGTTNFIRGIPHFAISIGIRKEGVIEHGLIYDPVKQELFSASRGQGAYLNNRRIRVSPASQLNQSILATGFPLRHPEKLAEFMTSFGRVVPHSGGIRRAGSAALDLAYVAAGRFDGYFETGIKIWDIAAGVVLVQEAGGIVSDFAGLTLPTDNTAIDNIVATTPKIATTLIDHLSL